MVLGCGEEDRFVTTIIYSVVAALIMKHVSLCC